MTGWGRTDPALSSINDEKNFLRMHRFDLSWLCTPFVLVNLTSIFSYLILCCLADQSQNCCMTILSAAMKVTERRLWFLSQPVTLYVFSTFDSFETCLSERLKSRDCPCFFFVKKCAKIIVATYKKVNWFGAVFLFVWNCNSNWCL